MIEIYTSSETLKSWREQTMWTRAMLAFRIASSQVIAQVNCCGEWIYNAVEFEVHGASGDHEISWLLELPPRLPRFLMMDYFSPTSCSSMLSANTKANPFSRVPLQDEWTVEKERIVYKTISLILLIASHKEKLFPLTLDWGIGCDEAAGGERKLKTEKAKLNLLSFCVL